MSQLVTGIPVTNEIGDPNTYWQELDTVWAAIEPLTGRELFAQQQVQSEVTVRIRIRYRNDISSEMKVEYGTKTYDIETVIDKEEKHQELQLMCSEGVINA